MTFQIEFPDFPASDMPAIPAGFEDTSWHNDICPSFTNEAARLTIWIDYANPAEREIPDSFRFGLVDFDGAELIWSNDWSAVLATIATAMESAK